MFRTIGTALFPVRLTVCHYSTVAESVKNTVNDCSLAAASVTIDNQYEALSRVVTPLANLEYLQQLKLKTAKCRDALKLIKGKHLPPVKTKFHTIIPSPVVDEYRNKDEFSVRTGVDGDPKTVGYFIGSPARDKVICVEPSELRNLKPWHKTLAKVFQNLIRESSLKACHDLHDGGFWRSLTVRSNLKGDTMAVVVVHPQGATNQEVEKAKAQIVDHFRDCKLTSLYFQSSPHTRATHSMAPYELLEGERHIYEWLGEYKFRISPDSFFQINTVAAPLLYNAVLNFVSPSNRSSLLDLCCGTGAVSIFSSKFFRGCVGIDSVANAVEDAVYNASANHVTNCYFEAGMIEKRLNKCLAELDMSPELSAVLNPGRGGCSTKNTIKSLRRCEQIRELVYVSCKVDHPNVLSNVFQLCNPSFDESQHFFLTDFQPVDLFPHTNHCEVLMLFQR